jgi:hypothetical protein
VACSLSERGPTDGGGEGGRHRTSSSPPALSSPTSAPHPARSSSDALPVFSTLCPLGTPRLNSKLESRQLPPMASLARDLSDGVRLIQVCLLTHPSAPSLAPKLHFASPLQPLADFSLGSSRHDGSYGIALLAHGSSVALHATRRCCCCCCAAAQPYSKLPPSSTNLHSLPFLRCLCTSSEYVQEIMGDTSLGRYNANPRIRVQKAEVCPSPCLPLLPLSRPGAEFARPCSGPLASDDEQQSPDTRYLYHDRSSSECHACPPFYQGARRPSDQHRRRGYVLTRPSYTKKAPAVTDLTISTGRHHRR